MALNVNFQQAISLNKLYKVNKKPVLSGESEQLVTNLYVNSGNVDVYGYNGATEPSSLSDMVLNHENTEVYGTIPFFAIPSYIAIVQNEGTTTELILTGFEAEEIKNIS
jgi:hypothetical protein